jgi:hypothetical protein
MSPTIAPIRLSKRPSPSEADASASHIDRPTYTKRLARVVLPMSAAFTTIYASGFTYAIATSERDPSARDPGDVVASGEVKPGWRYDVSTRGFPRTYRLDVVSVRTGAETVCAVEVVGYPKPLRAIPGAGSRLRVLFDRPLEGSAASMMEVDLMKGTRIACAARVHNGRVLDEGLEPGRDVDAPPVAELKGVRPPA